MKKFSFSYRYRKVDMTVSLTPNEGERDGSMFRLRGYYQVRALEISA